MKIISTVWQPQQWMQIRVHFEKLWTWPDQWWHRDDKFQSCLHVTLDCSRLKNQRHPFSLHHAPKTQTAFKFTSSPTTMVYFYVWRLADCTLSQKVVDIGIIHVEKTYLDEIHSFNPSHFILYATNKLLWSVWQNLWVDRISNVPQPEHYIITINNFDIYIKCMIYYEKLTWWQNLFLQWWCWYRSIVV